jgi:hypothetical protein
LSGNSKFKVQGSKFQIPNSKIRSPGVRDWRLGGGVLKMGVEWIGIFGYLLEVNLVGVEFCPIKTMPYGEREVV